MLDYNKLRELADENLIECPVCKGAGLVPVGFYKAALYAENVISHSEDWTNCETIKETFEMCRTCNGTGKIWGKNGL